MYTAQAWHRARWYILALVAGILVLPGASLAGSAVQPDVRLSGAPAFLSTLGQRWLNKMLRSRGFSICIGEPATCRKDTIQVQLSSSGAVQIRKGTAKRLFRVPSRYKEAQLKARAVVTFVALFVEMTNPGLAPPPFRPPPLRSKPKAAKRTTAPTRRANRNTPKRMVPRRRPRSQRRTRPPKKRAIPKPKRIAAKAKRATRPRPRATPRKRDITPTPRRTASIVRSLPPTTPKVARKRPKVAQVTPPTTPAPSPSISKRPRPIARTLPTRRVAPKEPIRPKVRPKKPALPEKRTRLQRRLPPPKRAQPNKRVANLRTTLAPTPPGEWLPQRGWLALGVEGTLGLQDLSGVPAGGGLFLGGGRGLWGLRLGLQLQPVLGLAPAHTGMMGRADLLLGLAPLRQRFQLWIEAGPSVELLWLNAKDKSVWQPRVGGLLGLRLAYALHPRVHLYARPALLLFPQRYEFQYQGAPMLVASIWRIELALGAAFRFW